MVRLRTVGTLLSAAAFAASCTDEPTRPRVPPTPSALTAATAASRIAFASDRDGNWEIYVVNADGSGLVRLTNDPAADSTPSWSPDGRRIAFTSTRDGNAETYYKRGTL